MASPTDKPLQHRLPPYSLKSDGGTPPLRALHPLSLTIIHRQMGGAHPENDLSLRHDRLDDWGGIGIPTVRQRDVLRPQEKVAEVFAGMVIREENSDKLSPKPP